MMHEAAGCPSCFADYQSESGFWQARPEGSRLVGLVVQRDNMPPVVSQREVLTRFGVTIENFRHPAPDTLESWEARLQRLFSRLGAGDVLVVASVHALGRDASEEVRTINELARRGVMVKVVSHGQRHLEDAAV